MSFSTPAPKSKQKGYMTPYKTPSAAMYNAKAVDLVTGKATVEYFFDPSLMIVENANSSYSMTPFKTSKKNDADDSLLFSCKHLFAPCTIIKSLDAENVTASRGEYKEKSRRASIAPPGPALVKTRDGTLYKVKDATKLVALTSPDDYVGMNDVLHLTNVTESSLLHAIRVRYRRDDIYTSAGPILISVNPYKQITSPQGESLYSENTMLRYRTSDNFSEEYPHLFKVADRAYSAMMDSVHIVPNLEDSDPDHNYSPGKSRPGQVINQSIIISGESGAGKTEATKYIMKYLARITKKKEKWGAEENLPFLSPDGKMMAALEDRVLSSNPLLETFGNAQTLRNDNSSRFGKFIHINFSTEKGVIMGARISNYLLEKTRITTQIEGERNYHVFYQLFAGAEPSFLTQLGLDVGTSSFRYLGSRSSQKTETDQNNFVETMKCLSNIGLASEEQNILMGVAAAVLHIGNISFEEGDTEENSAVITKESSASLQKACELLGLEETTVADAILTKLLTIGGKSIKKPSTVAMAEDRRDSLAKMTYSSMFLWLVKSINETLRKQESSSDYSDDNTQTGFIGVLDIYGFECFEVNGYEQLLINFCNEKLQRHFNRHVFEVEQRLYASEGVDWTYITFNDNQPCLDLIEGGGGVVGILNTLDDSYSGMGSCSEKDIKFVSQLHKLFGSVAGAKDANGGHAHFGTPKFGNDRQFNILHYAGEVLYTADGFVEKNMESTSNELKDLGSTSTIPLARDIYSASSNSDRRSTIRGVSVATQFKLSLQSLVDDLEQTQPHYIRCIKPNLKKASNLFNAGEVLKQLRYSGMMEAIRIRREGYGLREDHQSFYNRFSVLLSADDLKKGVGIGQLVKVLSKRLNVTEADWQIGHSKIFLRRELSDKLERLAKLRVHRAARTLGRFGRLVASRRASSLLVNWVKFRLFMIKKHRANRSSTKIAATYRMHVQVKNLKAYICAAVKIQSIQRLISAKFVAAKLRDPFYKMTHKELKKVLRSEVALMENAIKDQDFTKAAAIEEKIESLKVAINERTPMTRKRLEEKISTVQKQFDEAIQNKDYKEAGPLQDKIEELKGLRKEYLTVDELRDRVMKAEEAVASAAKNRDFSNAASLQKEVVNAKKRLEEALDEDDESDEDPEERDDGATVIDGIESRADLEIELKELHKQVDKAISKKDFQSATKLQLKIEEREKLRSFFPTFDELDEELQAAKASLEKAIASKKFENAAKLNEDISTLEKKIEDVKNQENANLGSGSACSSPDKIIGLDGKELSFESRRALETEIKVHVSMQAKEISSKNFSKAQKIQAFIDKLESLRSTLPSVTELRQTISDRKEEMDKAISEKRFTDAEKLDKEIGVLETKLSSELKFEKPEESLPGTVKVTAKPTRVDIDRIKTISTSSGGSVKSKENKKKHVNKKAKDSRQVAKLRPKKPLISSVGDSVLSVTQMLASKRGSASLVVSSEGSLAGIITDTDITRRLVAKQLDASSTSISKVMTPNPTCVAMTDSAMDAMTTMVENHFRHLPVVDGKGGVVGLLDIAKCLNDAISKIEKSNSKSDNAAHEALAQAMQAQGAQGAQAAALQALLGPLMSQAFGNQVSPSLRSLLAGKPSTIVEPSTSVLDAGIKMAESRKAALVVEDGRLVGIFGFKDMMTRVVAKELPMGNTKISAVMTPNPESVSPDMTVLEALQTMHDNKFLTLPVCEEDGTVVGLVNVMDVIYGCGGADGWRSIFNTTLDLDDLSDTASHTSGRSNSVDGIVSKQSNSSFNASKVDKSVIDLRPNKPVIACIDDSVLSVTKNLATNRRDAAILVDTSGELKGIVTDTDITRRVVAQGVDVIETCVADIMTSNPKCVDQNSSGMQAMMMMIENRFRHVPVVNQRQVVGTLDIAKCLNNAISKLEGSASSQPNAAEKAMKEAIGSRGGVDAAALEALLFPLIDKAFGSSANIPSLQAITSSSSCAIVSPETSVSDAATVMAEKRKAALIVDEGQLTGIFGFKDMMTRVVAAELDPTSTAVSAVMTPDPEFAEPGMTAIEALKMMHDNKFLTLPICEEDGSVVGIVDVMDLIHACGGPEHWRSIFEASLQVDESFANESTNTSQVMNEIPSIKISKNAPMVSSSPPRIPSNIPSTLEFRQGLSEDFDETTLNDTFRMEVGSFLSERDAITFKIIDPEGNTHRLRSEAKITSLREVLAAKLKGRVNVSSLSLKFFDEEGDAILISTDDDLNEAVSLARNASQGGKLVVKLVAEQEKGNSDGPDPMIFVGVGVGVLTVALGAIFLFPKQRASRY